MTQGQRALLGCSLLLALIGPTTAAAAAGRIDVAVAIDFGSGRRDPVVTCVTLPAGSSGSAALAAALAKLRLAQATYADSGLLCSIGGWPKAGECGRRDAAGYHYWSYFHGSASGWTYASNGPAANRASEASAEGWRFQDAGTGRPGDPAPRLSATDRSACADLHPAGLATTTTTGPARGGSEGSASTPSTSAKPPVAPATTIPTPSLGSPRRAPEPTAPASARGEDAGDDAGQGGGGGSGGWVSLGAALVLLLGGGGLWRRNRRGR